MRDPSEGHPPLELQWNHAASASSLYASWAMLEGWSFVDAELESALRESVTPLDRAIRESGADPRRFFDHLLPLASQIESRGDLARTALSKALGQASAVASASRLAGLLGDVERAFLRARPKAAEELTLRQQPIRMQWDARGPGLLRLLGRLTDADFVVSRATVSLVYPITGGGGMAHPFYNAVTFEAVLTDVTPKLPEVARLAWLVAQLNVDLPRYSERLTTPRAFALGSLALIPLVLSCAAEVELAHCDEETIETAVASWRPELAADLRLPETLHQWWQIYRDSRPSLAAALLALEQMLNQGQP